MGKASTSVLTLDVMPQDSETDMAAMEAFVRAYTKDGLTWQGSQVVPFMFGMNKMQITCLVDDQKIDGLADLLEAELVKDGENPFVSQITIVDFQKL